MADEKIITQLAEVRRTGATNMLDKRGVQKVASQLQFTALVDFIDDASNEEYMNALQTMGNER